MSERSGRPIALVLLASFALSLLIALTLPLLDPDEGRNAEVAREMATGGDLVVPHLAGMPYLDKPPAFFWATALSVRALGHTPVGARLPSMIASLLTLWLIGRAASRAGGTRFAVITTALLASAPLFAGLSAYVIFDMLLTLCVTVVWLGVAREVAGEGSPGLRLAMFAAIALGVLTKGPVTLAWAIGGSLGAALLLRSRAPLRWLAWLPGWIVALAPPAIWFAMVTRRFPEFPHYALIEETFERVSTGSFHRDQPWWFVPAVFVGGALPWSLATPWSPARFARAEEPVKAGAKVGLGFALFAGVFFSLSHSKLVTYLLPAFPPLAWTAAAMWSDRAVARRSGIVVGSILAAGAASLGGMGMTSQIVRDLARGQDVYLNEFIPVLVVGVLAVGCFLAGMSVLRRQSALSLVACLVLTPAAVLLIGPAAHESGSEKWFPSGASLARAVAPLHPAEIRYERCYSPGTDFLIGRTSRVVTTTGEETTSNYQVRYRGELQARGFWRGIAAVDTSDHSGILIGRHPTTQREGWQLIYSDHRFSAFRFTGWRAPIGPRDDRQPRL